MIGWVNPSLFWGSDFLGVGKFVQGLAVSLPSYLLEWWDYLNFAILSFQKFKKPSLWCPHSSMGSSITMPSSMYKLGLSSSSVSAASFSLKVNSHYFSIVFPKTLEPQDTCCETCFQITNRMALKVWWIIFGICRGHSQLLYHSGVCQKY